MESCTHKRKEGRKPSNNCLTCWRLYFKEKPGGIVTNNDIARLFDAMFWDVMEFKVDRIWKEAQ